MVMHRTLHSLLTVLALALGTQASAQTTSAPAPIWSPAPLTTFEYDAEGRPKRVVQAPHLRSLYLASTSVHDRLGRLSMLTDPLGGTTSLSYGFGEGPSQVQDPRQLSTVYSRDGFGQARQLSSPDTGVEQRSFDAEGNLRSRTDSRGVVSEYTYDALNRQTSVTHRWGSQEPMSVLWRYDETGPAYRNGIGRLTSTAYKGGGSRHTYDAHGRPETTTQFIEAGSQVLSFPVTLNYTPGGKVAEVTYPSGLVLYFAYAGGHLASVNMKARGAQAPIALFSEMASEPFGSLRKWASDFVQPRQAHALEADEWGRTVRYTLGPLVRDLGYDGANRVIRYAHRDGSTGVTTPESLVHDMQFEYDKVGRLTGANSATANWRYAYDANGNRTLSSLNGVSRVHAVAPDSNRLLTLSRPTRVLQHDAAGNTVADFQMGQGWTAGYDLANRLAALQLSRADGSAQTAGYLYDAFGRRVVKLSELQQACSEPRVCRLSAPASTGTVYVYGPEDVLLGEYSAVDGRPLREYIWLGTLPAAMVDYPPGNDTGVLYDIHTDHLGTPRMVLDTSGRVRWRWMSEPFGSQEPEEDPLGLGPLVFNLRMPGQYFDGESGLSYNYHRQYDSKLGRYTQSDPIGLAGGINTYAYVGGNPISFSDPKGLAKWSGTYHARSLIEGVGAGWVDLELTSECVNGKRFRARVKGVGPGLGVGVKGLIASEAYGKVDLKDPYDDIRPDRLQGTFTWASAGIAIGTFDRSVGRVVVGSAHGWNPEHGSGLDIGVTGIFGSSTLMGGKWEDCSCEAK